MRLPEDEFINQGDCPVDEHISKRGGNKPLPLTQEVAVTNRGEFV